VKFFSIGLFRQKAHDGSMSSGTGVFTQLVLETCAPEAVVAIDPDGANRLRPQADAQALPFPDRYFEVITSALVLDFIPDRRRALTECTGSVADAA
jgi:ubiquinone/menaquinone biosynthesis C-methylase UbiE